MKQLRDVAIVGGGAAGLSAAITLSRSRRSVVVIDDHRPRNAPADRMHNYLGRESASPRRLLSDGRAEAARYNAEFLDARATSVTPAAGHFRVETEGGPTLYARRVLIATGVADELPAVGGLAERWGRDVLHCAYCHGWEVRDQRILVLGTGPLTVHHALLFRQLSQRVTVLRHNDFPLSGIEATQLEARGVEVVDGPAASVVVEDGRLAGLRLVSGTVLPCDAVVVATVVNARIEMLKATGMKPAELRLGDHLIGTFLPTTDGATAVPGIYAAGNVTNLRAQVISAAAAGTEVAAAINADLVMTEVTADSKDAANA